MTKIKQKNYLPEWFDLTKYSQSKSFRAAEWYINLNARQELLLDHPDYIFKLPKSHENYTRCLADWRSKIPAMAESLRNNPIQNIDNHGLIAMTSQSVRPVTIRDLSIASYYELSFAERHPTPQSSLAAEKWKILGDKRHKVDPEIADLEFTIFEKPILAVNLNATDSVLVAAFSAWLKETRSAPTKSPSKREQPAYRSWARYGLLPYLDLLIWSKETGNRITYQGMANAVRYIPGGDSFRKTVSGLAKNLMTDLAELECLAAIETTKRNDPEKLGS